MSIEQKLCEVKIFQLQFMSNVIRSWSKVCIQKFWYFLSGLDIQLEQSKNDIVATILYAKKSVAGYQIQREKYFYFSELIRTYGLAVKVSRRESGDLGSNGFIPARCWNSLLPLAIVRGSGGSAWHWASQ